MTDLLIKNVSVLQPGEGIVGTSVLIRQGKIATIDPTPGRVVSTETIDGGGRLLTPGLIDIHTHGIGHYLYERSPDELVAGVSELGRFGVTCVLPTLYAVMRRETLGRFEALVDALDRCSGTHVRGFHLEGPFLALPGAWASTESGDLGWLNELLAVGRGQVAAMSVSPDTPNILPVIERLVEAEVAVFITHTRADVDQTQAAINAGARHATP